VYLVGKPVWSSQLLERSWTLLIIIRIWRIQSIEHVQIVTLLPPELRVVAQLWLPDDINENILSVPGDVKADTMHFDAILGWDIDAITDERWKIEGL
jgi:hypothetical protein